MFSKLPPTVMIALKSVMYLLVFVIAWLPLNAWHFMEETGQYNLYAWWPLFLLLVALPVVAVNLRVWVRTQLAPLAWPAPQAREGEPLSFVSLTDCTETVPVYARQSLAASQLVVGPALIIEPVATTLIKHGWQAQVSTAGHILLSTR